MDVKSTCRLDRDNALRDLLRRLSGCNASTKGALKLTRLGFNVKELMGGLDWWMRDGYETEGRGRDRRHGSGVLLLLLIRLISNRFNFNAMRKYLDCQPRLLYFIGRDEDNE